MLAYTATGITLIVLAAMMWCYDSSKEFRRQTRLFFRSIPYLPWFLVTSVIGAMRPKGYQGRHFA